MSSVIKFLEKIGSSPKHAFDSIGSYANQVACFASDSESARALIARDVEAINRILGAREVMCCMIVTPDQDSPVDVPDNDRREDPEKESEGERS